MASFLSKQWNIKRGMRRGCSEKVNKFFCSIGRWFIGLFTSMGHNHWPFFQIPISLFIKKDKKNKRVSEKSFVSSNNDWVLWEFNTLSLELSLWFAPLWPGHSFIATRHQNFWSERSFQLKKWLKRAIIESTCHRNNKFDVYFGSSGSLALSCWLISRLTERRVFAQLLKTQSLTSCLFSTSLHIHDANLTEQ